MKVEIGKKYTSNGKNLRVVCIDREDTLGYKVVGVFDNGDIKCFRVNGDSALDSKYDLIEVWEPTDGEWCWFWNKGRYESLTLARFILTDNSEKFYSYGLCGWECCIKFDGTFPEHLKNIKNGEI
jgi:hypothetical protein